MPNVPRHGYTRPSHSGGSRATHTGAAPDAVRGGSAETVQQDAIDQWFGEQNVQEGSITAGHLRVGSVTADAIEAGSIDTEHFAATATISLVSNDGATVVIDAAGISIADGALSISDEFSKSSMNASGLTGSWEDQATTGLRNGSFIANSGSTAVPFGRNANIPYWTTSHVVGSSTVIDAGVGNVTVDFTTATHKILLKSDLTRVRQGVGLSFFITEINPDAGASVVTRRVLLYEYEADGTLISTTQLDSRTLTGGGVGETTYVGTRTPDDAVGVLADPAQYIAIGIEVTGTTLNLSHARYRVFEVSFVATPENMGGAVTYPIQLSIGSMNATTDVTVGDLLSTLNLRVSEGTLDLPSQFNSATITGNQNNYGPAGMESAILVRLVTDSTVRTITGLTGDSGSNGQVYILHNRNSATPIILAHNSGSSTEPFLCPNAEDFYLRPKQTVMVYRNTTDTAWYVMAAGTGHVRGVVAIPFVYTGTITGTGETIMLLSESAVAGGQTRLPFAGKVVGISITLGTARTGGTLTARCYNGSTAAFVGPTATIDGTTTNNATATATAIGTSDLSAALYGVRLTGSGFTPTANTAKAVLYIALDDEI